MARQFPQDDFRLVKIPGDPSAAGDKSWRLSLPRSTIIHVPNTDDLDEERFAPIAAVCVESPFQQSITSRGPGFHYYKNDVVPTCAFYVSLLIPKTPGAPGEIEFQVRQANNCVNEIRFVGGWTPTTFTNVINRTQLLVQVSGLAGNQWEFWARLTSAESVPVDIVLVVAMMSQSDGNQAIMGAGVTGKIS